MTEIIRVVRDVWSVASFVQNQWWKKKMKERLDMLTGEIQRLSNEANILDHNYAVSDEFHSLAIRVFFAATKDHRQFKHGMLAAVLVNSVGGRREWPYDKKQLLVDLVIDLEPYHVAMLQRCPRPKSGPIHIHPWRTLASIPDLPDPQVDILINAIQKLSGMSLLTYSGGGHMMRNDDPTGVTKGGRLQYVTYLPDVLKASRFARTRLADDFLSFLSIEPEKPD